MTRRLDRGSRGLLARSRLRAHVRDMWLILAYNGHCTGQAAIWDQAEQQLGEARTGPQAEQAAAVAIAHCTTCPVADICAQWAHADHYTGLAAGQAWTDGKPRPAHQLRRRRNTPT